jgi:hypothetical protein
MTALIDDLEEQRRALEAARARGGRRDDLGRRTRGSSTGRSAAT